MLAMLKLSLGLTLAATLASAQIISSISGNLVTGGSITIDWTSDSTSAATFSVFIIHPSFNQQFALANNVQTSAGTLTAELPVLPPGDGYTVELVKIDDVNFVFSESKDFSVGGASQSVSTTITGHSNLPKTSATPISTPSLTPISTPSSPPTSASTPAANTESAPSSTAPSDSTSPSPSSTGSSGALSLGGSVSGALMVALGVVAGAYML
ncbi:hypothetical protein FB45DRAFT_999116 [Roridomyces roridus]|uniref:Yeast cell wall synthesis Kre9/Knh1-like N-terminal domain-containing protein n=1 Tax=Roridomyces roridus TaxID=1738132 RepID=A0AAD7CB17_9AGAR|nr:hypothetical protein FB45DRAFT_999116 [Roridomyces roridus]